MEFHLRLFFFALLTIVVIMPRTSFAQLPETGSSQRPNGEVDEQTAKILKEQAKKANKLRQEELKRDTEKLFQLASELKQYVDKTNENVLSLDVIKKTEEIEKLAHSVKTKMKAGY